MAMRKEDPGARMLHTELNGEIIQTTQVWAELQDAVKRNETHAARMMNQEDVVMAEYDNRNRGALFRNNRKEKETHPDYNGTINVEGKEYYLNAWLREGKSGKFFSMSVKPKESPVERRNDHKPSRDSGQRQNLSEWGVSGKPKDLDDFDDGLIF